MPLTDEQRAISQQRLADLRARMQESEAPNAAPEPAPAQVESAPEPTATPKMSLSEDQIAYSKQRLEQLKQAKAQNIAASIAEEDPQLAQLLDMADGVQPEKTPYGIGAVNQATSEVEQNIAGRPALLPEFIGRMKDRATQAYTDPSAAFGPPDPRKLAMDALTGAGAAYQTVESVPANAMLALQQGRPRDIPADIWKGIMGQRPAQLGDVVRGTGLPGSKIAAPIMGLAAMSLPGAAKKLATQLTDDIAKATAGGAKVGINTITAPIKKRVDNYVNQFQSFRNRMLPRINRGLRKYYDDLQKNYGDDLEKVIEQSAEDLGSANVDSVELAGRLKNSLAELGVLDDTGALMREKVAMLDPAGKELVRTVSSLTKEEQLPIILNAYGDVAAGGATQTAVPIKGGEIIRTIKNLNRRIRQSVKDRKGPINAVERGYITLRNELAESLGPHASEMYRELNRGYAANRTMWNEANKSFRPFMDAARIDRGASTLRSANSLIKENAQRAFLEQVENMSGVKFANDAAKLADKEKLLMTVIDAWPVKVGRAGTEIFKDAALAIGKNTPATARSAGLRDITSLVTQ